MWPDGLGRWTYGFAIGAAVYHCCEFKSSREKNKNLSAQRYNFSTFIYIYIYLYIYIPDGSYSRHGPCALDYTSTFLYVFSSI